MQIKPLSEKAQNYITWPLLIVTAPVWGLLIGLLWLTVAVEKALDPPGWRRVFALWPVQCDPWPAEGYGGWVWLEMVWRNPSRHPGAWTKYRREPPRLEEGRC